MSIVSVILPTYNRAATLKRSAESVLEQTYKDLELIVVDDASNDDTENVIRGFNDPRVQYIKLEENIGAAAARNRGIKAARGDFVAFQDSDDVWGHDKLAKQMDEFEQSDVRTGVVYSGICRITDGKRTYVPRGAGKREGDIHEMLLSANFVALPAAVVRKECFEKAGLFDESLPCLQDWELWIRISEYYRFKYIKESLVDAYYSADSISVNPEKLIKAWKYILDKHSVSFNRSKGALSKRYAHLAHYLCASGDIKEGREYSLEALEANPFNLTALIVLTASFFGRDLYKNMAGMLKK